MVGLDPAALADTVGRWNRYCDAEHDADFGRTLMLAPIADGPFYAVELSPSMLNTQGGPRRNERGQIVRPDGTPIPRLYSAGELGSIYSYLYQGTGNIGECLAFGRISGRNAAARNRGSRNDPARRHMTASKSEAYSAAGLAAPRLSAGQNPPTC